jgi:hypothetical protein
VEAVATLDSTMIAIAAVGCALFAVVVALTLSIRQSRLLKRYRQLLNGTSGQNLEQRLIEQATHLEQSELALQAMASQVEALHQNSKVHLQKVATLRFNAFPDVGSDLSFSIALLDAHNNGVVLSSLYSRNESRVYAKPIIAGKSTYSLSEEEKAVLVQAVTAGNP